MAAAETAQSGYALRAASLLGVLLVARALTLAGHELPPSIWSPLAYLWQDVLVALLFVIVDRSLRRPHASRLLYGLLVVYISLNVPVTRVLSTPLTWTMLRAARGPIADAVLHYVTASNLIALAIPLVAGLALPRVLQNRGLEINAPALIMAVVIVAIGPFATSRVETGGRHRNPFGALMATTVTRVAAKQATDDWRVSPVAVSEPDEDTRMMPADDGLTSLRGSMRGRNVVLVALESTAARHLGLYGGRPDPAPNLTALARQAIVFDRAYAVYPESIKGLFATLCSRYPAFDVPPNIYAEVPCASIASALESGGYRTALFHSGRFMYLGMRSIIDRRGFDVMEDAGAIGGRVDSSFGVDDASTVKRTLGWIDSLGQRAPFFVTYLPTSGHNPYVTTTPGPFRADSDFWRYMNALHEGDAALGMLIDGLRQRRLLDNTLIVLFGDHGEAFGEHPGNFAHTLYINEENVHIPLVIAAPGAIRAPIHLSRIASVVDIAPTILDLLGFPSQRQHQGTSLLLADSRMALFYTDYSIGWLGLADRCWKYLYDVDSKRSRLFDVCNDPGETRDQASEHAERVVAYRDRVVAWAAAQKDLIERRQ